MSEKIVGFVGLIGSGKSTASQYLIDKGYEPVSFAKPLKDAVATIFNWPRDLVEGSTETSRQWREEVDEYWSHSLGWDVTPRAVLQKMGTEAGRDVFGKNLWVSSALTQVYESSNNEFVFTDVRFSNEIEALKKAGAKIYCVSRGNPPSWFNRISGLSAIGKEAIMRGEYPDVHISEWDWVGNQHIEHEWLDNSGTLEKFYQQIDERVL